MASTLVRSQAREALMVQGQIRRLGSRIYAANSDLSDCLPVKGTEDILNKPFAFEISSGDGGGGYTVFFVADNDKEKEDWINSIGRSIVQHSMSVTDYDILDYDHMQ
ncbi:unnamed protein product [Cochlearia groenlandica]